MVQILPQRTNIGNQIGQALQQGITRGADVGFRKGMLQEAFNKLSENPNADFTQQLKNVLPSLLSVEGGAQALETLGPILATQAQNQAIKKSIEERRSAQALVENREIAERKAEKQEIEGEKFRNPQAPYSEKTPFPQITAGPQPIPEPTPRQEEDYAIQLMENSLGTGKPIDYQTAKALSQDNTNRIRNLNNEILKQKVIRQEAQGKAAEGILKRAENSGLIKTAEDKTVAEKFSIESQNAENPAEQWEYVRSKMRAYDNAKSTIQRELGLGNPIATQYRKLFGTYKDQNELINDIQKPLNFFREHGLYDEGLNLLAEDLGFGNELAHRAMFPLSKQEQAELGKFSKNPISPAPISLTKKGSIHESRSETFPDERYALPDDDFTNFKNDLASFLQKNPSIDLVNLRSDLNQSKRYDWHDIKNALDQLIDERRFNPDIEQEKQLNSIRQPPVPGLGAYFQYLWTGKK